MSSLYQPTQEVSASWGTPDGSSIFFHASLTGDRHRDSTYGISCWLKNFTGFPISGITMNIKGLIPNIQIQEAKTVDRTGRAIMSDSAHDRDANGQESFSRQNGDQHEPMSDEQLKKAMDHLLSLPSFKEHKWTVELLTESSGSRFFLVKDNLGTLIRKIPESELWTLPTDNDPRGQLLKRSA